jgi:PRC-barrel domain protein
MATNAPDNRLCFLESHRLQGPLTDACDVWTRGGKRIGTLDGVVVNPAEHRACFLVVDRGRLLPDRCLVPLPAQLDVVHHALEVEDVEPSNFEKFNPGMFRRFADHTNRMSSRV